MAQADADLEAALSAYMQAAEENTRVAREQRDQLADLIDGERDTAMLPLRQEVWTSFRRVVAVRDAAVSPPAPF